MVPKPKMLESLKFFCIWFGLGTEAEILSFLNKQRSPLACDYGELLDFQGHQLFYFILPPFYIGYTLDGKNEKKKKTKKKQMFGCFVKNSSIRLVKLGFTT